MCVAAEYGGDGPPVNAPPPQKHRVCLTSSEQFFVTAVVLFFFCHTAQHVGSYVFVFLVFSGLYHASFSFGFRQPSPGSPERASLLGPCPLSGTLAGLFLTLAFKSSETVMLADGAQSPVKVRTVRLNQQRKQPPGL